jgi:1-acyl-sn-glycerol-3-phosphate acyltransferase
MCMGINIPFAIMKLYSGIWMRAKARVVVKGLDDLKPREKGERRVYLIINHSTSFDLVALMHVSKDPFAVLMDEAAFGFPIIRHILKGAGFIALHEADSKASVESCIAAVEAGRPLLISLHDGSSALGKWGRPRTGGIRIAHETGAKIYPVFLKVENERIRRLTFKAMDGTEHSYTTFKDSFYFIEFLKPLELSRLPPEPSREDFSLIAKSLDEKANSIEARYERYLEENRERFAPLKRRGGSRMRIAW